MTDTPLAGLGPPFAPVRPLPQGLFSGQSPLSGGHGPERPLVNGRTGGPLTLNGQHHLEPGNRSADQHAADTLPQASNTSAPAAGAEAPTADGMEETVLPAPEAEEKAARPIPSWPLLLLAAPAGVATWSGWVGLGERTGFGEVKPLPGVWDDLTINTAISLPVGVEAYAAYALAAWLSHRPMSTTTRRFAACSSIGSLLLGAAGQVAYHLLEVERAAAIKAAGTLAEKQAAEAAHAPWWITMLVSCLPVLVLGMGAALSHLLRRDAHNADLQQEPRDDVASSETDRIRTVQKGPDSGHPGDRAIDRQTRETDHSAGSASPADHAHRTPDPRDRLVRGGPANQTATDRAGTDGAAAAEPDQTAGQPHATSGHTKAAARVRPPQRLAEPGRSTHHAPAPAAADPDKLAAARAAAGELKAEGQPLSRRALRAKGIRGENQVLSDLVAILKNETEDSHQPLEHDAPLEVTS